MNPSSIGEYLTYLSPFSQGDPFAELDVADRGVELPVSDQLQQQQAFELPTEGFNFAADILEPIALGPRVLAWVDTFRDIVMGLIVITAMVLIYSAIRAWEERVERRRLVLAGVEAPGADTPAAIDTPGGARWEKILELFQTTNPSDWRLAIIESDAMLEEMTFHMGLPGDTLGERLQSTTPTSFPAYQAAWDAHKVRNRIAHDGMNFQLSAVQAARTLQQYEQVFRQNGYIPG